MESTVILSLICIWSFVLIFLVLYLKRNRDVFNVRIKVLNEIFNLSEDDLIIDEVIIDEDISDESIRKTKVMKTKLLLMREYDKSMSYDEMLYRFFTPINVLEHEWKKRMNWFNIVKFRNPFIDEEMGCKGESNNV